MTGKLLEEKAALALEGRGLWLSLQEGYSLSGSSQVVLVPHKEPVYMEAAVENLSWLVSHKKADRVLVLGTGSQGVEVPGSTGSGVPCFFHVLSARECGSLLALYALYEFTVNMQVVSLVLPEGRKGQGLVDTGQLGLKEALSVIVFENYGCGSIAGDA